MKPFIYTRENLRVAIECLLEGNFKQAIAFGPDRPNMPTYRVKATRVGTGITDIRLSIGRLNYEERKWAAKQLKVFGRVPRKRFREMNGRISSLGGWIRKGKQK